MNCYKSKCTVVTTRSIVQKVRFKVFFKDVVCGGCLLMQVNPPELMISLLVYVKC